MAQKIVVDVAAGTTTIVDLTPEDIQQQQEAEAIEAQTVSTPDPYLVLKKALEDKGILVNGDLASAAANIK